jgi:hypothetical protein
MGGVSLRTPWWIVVLRSLAAHRKVLAPLFVFQVTILAGVACRPTSTVFHTNNLPERHVQRSAVFVAMELDQCPAWCNITNDDINNRRLLIQHFDEIDQCSTHIVRAGVVRYLSKTPGEDERLLKRWSNIYVLNRYLFAVPTTRLLTERSFGGWVVPCPREDTLAELWPLEIRGGKLELTGVCMGYKGGGYNAIGEFDYFSQEYGRRRITTTVGR